MSSMVPLLLNRLHHSRAHSHPSLCLSCRRLKFHQGKAYYRLFRFLGRVFMSSIFLSPTALLNFVRLIEKPIPLRPVVGHEDSCWRIHAARISESAARRTSAVVVFSTSCCSGSLVGSISKTSPSRWRSSSVIISATGRVFVLALVIDVVYDVLKILHILRPLALFDHIPLMLWQSQVCRVRDVLTLQRSWC